MDVTLVNNGSIHAHLSHRQQRKQRKKSKRKAIRQQNAKLRETNQDAGEISEEAAARMDEDAEEEEKMRQEEERKWLERERIAQEMFAQKKAMEELEDAKRKRLEEEDRNNKQNKVAKVPVPTIEEIQERNNKQIRIAKVPVPTIEEIQPLPVNIKSTAWQELNDAIDKHKAINLTRGSPDFIFTNCVLRNLRLVADDNVSPSLHQYARSTGHPRLVNALAKLFNERFRHNPCVSGEIAEDLREGTFGADRCINPLTEIIISVGGIGALSTIFLALINPGDEVVVLEPAFGCYAPQIEAAGGVYVGVSLIPPKDTKCRVDSSEFTVDWEELELKITRKTKMLLMNTPFNPVGKVYTKAEMKKIADICIRHNLICLSDEVYEFLVFPPHKHYKIASFPGMWERTITIGSAGKVFGVTGWKIGWTIGPAPFINAMQLIQQNTTYAFCTPLQEALAQTIEEILPDMNTKDCLFRKLSVVLAEKRDRIANALASVGMWPVVPQGGFFMLANISNVEGPKREKDDKRPYDVIFNEWMMKNKGIAGAPLSAFFNDANSSFGDDYLRLCIVKDDSTIERVLECFKKW